MDPQRQVAYRMEADLINNSGSLSSLEQRALTNIFNRCEQPIDNQCQAQYDPWMFVHLKPWSSSYHHLVFHACAYEGRCLGTELCVEGLRSSFISTRV